MIEISYHYQVLAVTFVTIETHRTVYYCYLKKLDNLHTFTYTNKKQSVRWFMKISFAVK